MTSSIRWTSQDLLALPDDGKRYEIIDGELYMSKQPVYNHQKAAFRIARFLEDWSEKTDKGETSVTPGLVFSDDDDAVPDVAWISKKRLENALGRDGHFHEAPELIVEVLSPGSSNQSRDYEVKRKLYSRRGVEEYWVMSWQLRKIDVYRREPNFQELRLATTLNENDTLTSPLLEGFSCPLTKIFNGIS